mgnify:CR=1 FL=1
MYEYVIVCVCVDVWRRRDGQSSTSKSPEAVAQGQYFSLYEGTFIGSKLRATVISSELERKLSITLERERRYG